MKSKIEANSASGEAIYTYGAGILFVGIPKGMISSQISFLGSFDGFAFFPILDYSGQPVKISTKIQQPAPNPGTLITAPLAILPIAQPALFRGILMIQPVSSSIENADASIEFYFEPQVNQ